MKRVLIILFVFILLPSSLFAKSPFDSRQDPFPPSIKVSVLPSKPVVFPGQEFKFYVSVIVEEGWHIYSLSPFPGNELLQTKIVLDEHVFKEQDVWKEPNPVLIPLKSEEYGFQHWRYTGRVFLRIRLIQSLQRVWYSHR